MQPWKMNFLLLCKLLIQDLIYGPTFVQLKSDAFKDLVICHRVKIVFLFACLLTSYGQFYIQWLNCNFHNPCELIYF